MSDLQSVNTHGIVGLDRLIVHFVAAQQALSATSDVYAADEIVSKARGHVEQHAILHAKNIFITDGLHVQLRALQSVKTGLNTVGRKAQSDFEVSLALFQYQISMITISLPVASHQVLRCCK